MMRRTVLAASALAALAALAALGDAAGADAMPATGLASTLPPGPAIERVADGCGPGYFRTTAGQCFPNERFVGPYGGIHAPPPCPPGYLRAPNRPICFPVRR